MGDLYNEPSFGFFIELASKCLILAQKMYNEKGCVSG